MPSPIAPNVPNNISRMSKQSAYLKMTVKELDFLVFPSAIFSSFSFDNFEFSGEYIFSTLKATKTLPLENAINPALFESLQSQCHPYHDILIMT
ncbi:hypothetical protein CDL12_22619 [Handroanthus impetiginosus]|uniref:Uncharacterized protein n=1 Tax=Handroanthus impetiginosus TaxID=429701 RepID=A0A2G9GI14_9LAMI|nr:hypothetical protein CDL12_22619 [Handroanthus impetiginosus]